MATEARQSPLQQFISQQFRTTYDLTEWFVSFQNALKGLNAEQAQQKVNPKLPSIFEIVAHITYWNERYLKNIRQEVLEPVLADNDQTFTNTGVKDWAELLGKAEAVFSGWQKELDKAGEPNQKLMEVVGNIITHNAYHVGQIVFIRKLQGSWNPNDGVK